MCDVFPGVLSRVSLIGFCTVSVLLVILCCVQDLMLL